MAQNKALPLKKAGDYQPYFLMWERDLGDFLEWLRQDFSGSCQTVRAHALRQRNWTLGLVFAGSFGLLITCSWITRGIVRPLEDTASSLANGAAMFADEASKMAKAAASLSSGAHQQAASLEETSASLEELTSTTEANAEIAATAVETSTAAAKTAAVGQEYMANLTVTVAAAEHSGTAIRRILKTIDELAFQTNILALNAAVEAARAGEAGAGFAVVAEEVRTLAQRSAKAARETTALLAGEGATDGEARGVVESLARIREQSARVQQQFGSIVERIGQSDAHAGRIASASAEQAKGLAQITAVMHQLDSVTQVTAQTSGSVAATAELLQQKAEEMRAAAARLESMIGTSSRTAGSTITDDPRGSKT